MSSDLFTSNTPLALQELEETHSLSLYHPNLKLADDWALSHCILLAFDDEKLPRDLPGPRVETIEPQAQFTAPQGLRYENNVDGSTSSGPDAPVLHPASGEHKCPHPQSCKTCVPVNCKVCSHLLDFPPPELHGKVRRLREVDPRRSLGKEENSRGVCAHYLAVSYCRSDQTDPRGSEIDSPSPRTYEIRQLDGEMRPNRVPDHILDQAISACYVTGCRLLWIDQESSLPPSSPASWLEPAATRNWDVMFSLAHSTAGIMCTEIESSEELKALSFLVERGNRLQDQEESVRTEVLYHLVHLLDRIKLDRWYTCGSTLKEMINVGDDLLLVVHRDAAMSWEDVRWPPPDCRASLQRRQHPEVICLPVGDLKTAITELDSFLKGKNPLSDSDKHHKHWRCGHPRPAFAVVSTAASLHPRVRSPTLRLAVRVTDSMSISPGSRAEVVAALTLLKKRTVKDNAQLLELLSDLCQYETRFRPESIANFRGSMRAAVLRLSLLNGDLSLLIPEAYGSHPSRHYHCPACNSASNDVKSAIALPTKIADEAPGWLRPFNLDYSDLDLPDLYRANFIRQTGKHMYDSIDFRFPGYLWKIDSSLDLKFIQQTFKKEWLAMRPLCINPRQMEGETPHQTMLRGHLLGELVGKENVRAALQDNLLRTGTVGEDNIFWRLVPRSSCEISMMTLTQNVKENPKVRLALTALLLDILLFLYREAESGRQPLAQGVANSIWQSMRVDVLPPGDKPLPDQVGPALFEHPDIQTRAERIFRLNETQGWTGEFNQAWLLDRIMMNGQLWVGRFKRETPQWPPGRAGHAGRDLSTTGARGVHDPGASSESTASGLRPDVEGLQATSLEQIQTSGSSADGRLGPSQNPGEKVNGRSGEKSKTTSRMERQLRDMGLAGRIQGALWAKDSTPDEQDVHLPTGHLLSFILMTGDDDPVRMDEKREREYVSVFDVDDPCMVATPYSSDWEMLPHPEYRSMSVCWVVEPCPLEDGGVSTSDGKKSTRPRDPFDCGRYRVLDKVKGMWDIMDLPWQHYQFV